MLDTRLFIGIEGRRAEFIRKLKLFLGTYFFRCPVCGLTDGKIEKVEFRDGKYVATVVCKLCGQYLDTIWEGEL